MVCILFFTGCVHSVNLDCQRWRTTPPAAASIIQADLFRHSLSSISPHSRESYVLIYAKTPHKQDGRSIWRSRVSYQSPSYLLLCFIIEQIWVMNYCVRRQLVGTVEKMPEYHVIPFRPRCVTPRSAVVGGVSWLYPRKNCRCRRR